MDAAAKDHFMIAAGMPRKKSTQISGCCYWRR
jgi:hypothetical protein